VDEIRWFLKLAQSAPGVQQKLPPVQRKAPLVQKVQRVRQKTQQIPEKPASIGKGHWRRLKPGQMGHSEAGQEISGKTWVHRGRMRPKFKPKPHQAAFAKGFQQAAKKDGGYLALHGTGTGKTFSSIYAFEQLKQRGKAKRALVIAPAGLRTNFLTKGVQKFTESQGVVLEKPAELSPDVEYAIVSYAAFRQNPQAYLDAVKPDTIIADEIQRAVNESSKTHEALMHARKQAPRFMGLTASPVSNEPAEIVPLLQLASGERHPLKTRKQFRKKFMKGQRSKQRGIFGGQVKEKKVVNIEQLKRAVGPSIHYVEDLDATEKPAKEVELVKVDMSKEQEKLYRMSMKGVDPKIVMKIQEGKTVSSKEAMNVFTRLTRARQVSNSLHTVTKLSPEDAAKQTPKIKKILDDAQEHLAKTPDGQIIMYTNIVHGGVDVLEAGLKQRGVPYGRFVGRGVEGVTEESRQQAVEDYLAGKNRVIIITGAGAEGLSLGNTTMVQMVDGHYNPQRIAQAEARGVRAGGLAHRAPEARKVRVKRYVSSLPKGFWRTVTFQDPEKSVGEWVYGTAARKAQLNRQLRQALQARSTHEEKRRDSLLYRMFRRNP
jgi:SNF2 family DNA or RNA helicase